eukprot:EC123428.1.p1 GENE.EC123428.1~~EC123428.1.p1  ORF type:complete len:110 (+),score=13.00 EC123428.1:174-503(+)
MLAMRDAGDAAAPGGLEDIPGVLGLLTLDLSGHVLSASGELSGAVTEPVADCIFRLLEDVAHVLATSEGPANDSFRRLTVALQDHQYVISIANKKIYAAKVRPLAAAAP